MDIRNIALVRATNTIPFDGIVRPISEVPYLKKDKSSAFYNAMYDLLKKQGKLKELDWSNLDRIEEIGKENSVIAEQYTPYNSNYNSTVLWTLNGLVPDDQENTFSNKTCAIIEGLEEQIEQSEVVSLMPTDTAIKGKVELSNQAIIMINKERFESLSQEEKEKLEKLALKVKIFEGDLKENVDKQLKESARYTAETLTITRRYGGYINSDTSEELKQTINNIAEEREIPQVLFRDIVTKQNDELEKLKSVNDEYENTAIVNKFYQETFLKFLFEEIDMPEENREEIIGNLESIEEMKKVTNQIEKIGLDKYVEILNIYNGRLEELQKNGELPTPQQIVDSIRENKKIDLNLSLEEEIEHSADTDLKQIALEENIKNQKDIVAETKNAIISKEIQRSRGEQGERDE